MMFGLHRLNRAAFAKAVSNAVRIKYPPKIFPYLNPPNTLKIRPKINLHVPLDREANNCVLQLGIRHPLVIWRNPSLHVARVSGLQEQIMNNGSLNFRRR
jgi:hypothetical protein